MSMEWSQEQRDAAAERVRIYWSDPKRKRERIKNIGKGVRKALKDPVKRSNLIAAVKRGGITRTTSMKERFWEDVDKDHGWPREKHMPTNCWLWIGPKQTIKQRRVPHRVYGLIHKGGKHGNKMLVHRYAYQLQVGPLIKGQQVRHLCDSPLCVRGSHLEQGTPQDNSNDMKKRDRPRGRYRTTSAKP